MELFKTVPAYSWLLIMSQILKFTKYSMKLIEKLPRRHLINSSDVFVIKGFTVSDSKFFNFLIKKIKLL